MDREDQIKELEQELFEMEKYITDIWQFYPTPLAYLNPQGTILDMDDVLADLFGLSKEDIIGSRLADFSPQREKILAFEKETIEKGFVKSLETVVKSRQGKEIPVVVSSMIRKDEKGNIIGYFISLLDITEHKRAEEALHKSEERFRQVAENAEEFIWEVDKDGLYTYTNPVVKKILGYKPEEIVGKKYFYDFFQSDSREALKKAALATFADKVPFKGFINQNMHKNGNTVILETRGMPVLDEKGGLIGYRGTDVDITERKRAEEAVKDTAYQFQAVVESVGEGITFSDSSGKFLVYNLRMQELTGYTVDEANNSGDFTGLLYPQPLERQKALQRLQEIVEHKVALPLEVETTIQAKDGTKKVLWISTVAMRFKDQKMFLSIYRDITERRKAEEVLRESDEWVRTILKSLITGVFVIDEANHTIVDANPLAIEMIGAPREAIVGHVCHNFVCPAEKGKCPVSDLGQTVDKSECVLLNVKGERIPIYKTVTPATMGRRKYLIESFIDITERKRAEEEKKERMEELEIFNKAAVGRELKIIELEEEIKRLKGK